MVSGVILSNMEERDDSYYISRVLDGQPDAFAPLVDRYKTMAYNISLGIVKRPEDAEEITQDSFVKAYRSLRGFKGDARFSTWLFRIVYNTSVSHLRKKKREIVSDLSDNQLIHEGINEEGGSGNEELMAAALKNALELLPGEERTMISLYYYQDSSVVEIAEIMDMSVSNIKVRLFRTRKKLYEHIKGVMKNEIYL